MVEANLVVDKVSPWPATRITAATGFTGFLVWLAAAGLPYLLLSGMGLSVPVSEMIGGEDSISAGFVLGLAAAVGALWRVLLIGLMALDAVIYNVCGGLVGGLKISPADDGQAAQPPVDPGVTPVRWRRDRVGSEAFPAVWSWSSRNGYLMTASS